MNHTRRHSYYVRRTMDWLTHHGYISRKTETNYTVLRGSKTVFVKEDFWGADVSARHSTFGLHFIQVKTSLQQLGKGIAQLTQDDNWPPNIGRAVVFWPPRGRLEDGPYVFTVNPAGGPAIQSYLQTKHPCDRKGNVPSCQLSLQPSK